MDGHTELNWKPKVTATEQWLKMFPTTEVRMNEPGRFANDGEVLLTNGFNGCTALLVRIETPDQKVIGFLAHKHLDSKRVREFVKDLANGNFSKEAKLYGTVLYAGDAHGQSLGLESEKLQQVLQQDLKEKFTNQWQILTARRYAIYEGYPVSVNSNRLAYNVRSNMWSYREGTHGSEQPLSGLLKWTASK